MLLTYSDYTKALSLVPGSGGAFEVSVNGEIIFSKTRTGRYPEISELEEAINRLLT